MHGREIKEGVLYGSGPPEIESVWKKITPNIRISKHKRSTVTGKEKQVDTSLVVDITKTAIKTCSAERGTIAVASGDADVIPALEAVLGEHSWKIEIYTWQHTAAEALKKFKDQNCKKVKIIYLNEHQDEFTFVETKSKQQPDKRSVVFTFEANTFSNDTPTEAWRDQLEKITKWPVIYHDAKYIVSFPDYEKKPFLIEDFVKNFEKYRDMLKATEVQTYENWIRMSKRKRKTDDPCPAENKVKKKRRSTWQT